MSAAGVITAEIAGNGEIAKGIFRMALRLPPSYPSPEPGQFVNIYLNDRSRLLPRPISVCGFARGEMTLVYAVAGGGTKAMSAYGRGVSVRVSTPLGNGFDTEGRGAAVLIGGGAGVPPMLFLAKRLAERFGEERAEAPRVRAVLGFRSEPFLTGEFPLAPETATDDGSAGFRGNVVDLLRETGVAAGSRLFACGPRPMLKALAGFARERGLALQVSLEERMGCGYGACVGCVCKTAGGSRKVCEDGPVFDAGEVAWE